MASVCGECCWSEGKFNRLPVTGPVHASRPSTMAIKTYVECSSLELYGMPIAVSLVINAIADITK